MISLEVDKDFEGRPGGDQIFEIHWDGVISYWKIKQDRYDTLCGANFDNTNVVLKIDEDMFEGDPVDFQAFKRHISALNDQTPFWDG